MNKITSIKLLLALIVVCFVLNGCLKAFSIRVNGNDPFNPVFISDSEKTCRRFTVTLMEEKQISNDKFINQISEGKVSALHVMWDIAIASGEKQQSLREIHYGIVPKGFHEITNSSSLEIGSKYEIELICKKGQHVGAGAFEIYEINGNAALKDLLFSEE